MAALFAAFALLVIGAPAGASTQSQAATLVPAAVQTPVGVTSGQVKRKKKHPKKPGMGALAPKNPMYTYRRFTSPTRRAAAAAARPTH